MNVHAGGSGTGAGGAGRVAADSAGPTPPDGAARLLLLALLGLAARFVVAGCSWGTTDTITFLRFAFRIDQNGILATYRGDPEFNHPPIPAYWAWLSLVLAGRSAFLAAFIFRVPIILADFASAWLLWRLWRRRAGPGPRGARDAAGVVALYAWCPAALLVSGYHGNTDPVYAFLCLLSVYLIHDRGRPFWGGVALAAAVNVKLIPLLLIPPLALSLRGRGDFLRFTAGVSLGALPFLPLFVLVGPSMRENVLGYKSQIDMWGVNFFLLMTDPPTPGPKPTFPPSALFYREYGRFLLLALVAAWAVAGRRRWPRWDLYDVATVTLAVFLIFAPGFGVQYTVVLVPLLFAARVGVAVLYGALAGLFLLASYYMFWDGGFPISSLFHQAFGTPLGILGLMAWSVLIYYLINTLWRGTTPEARTLSRPDERPRAAPMPSVPTAAVARRRGRRGR